MLCENVDNLGWWMRNEEAIAHIQKYGHNPNYISSAELKKEKLNISSDLNAIVSEADCLVLAIPSAFLKETLAQLHVDIKEKFIMSAIKGIVPENNTIIGDFFHNQYQILYSNIGVVTGPCHAEEVAMERLSYLTIACADTSKAKFVAKNLSSSYIKTKVTKDIIGTEYAAMLKNIYAIAAGIAHGLGYGDNFQSVLMSNAIREMKRYTKSIHKIDRNINDSAYLGDLLVTGYSTFSRNRMFGNMIGKGYTVKSAQMEMNMVAEGYYAAKSAYELKGKFEKKVKMLTNILQLHP